MAVEATDKLGDPYEKTANFARALSHPARVKIVEMLSEEGAMTCGMITEQIPLSQATVSQHLKLLKEANVIEMEKDGLKSIYTLKSSTVTDAHSFIYALLNQMINPL
jgi:DNA-binding transcriptional ArsR family regulator